MPAANSPLENELRPQKQLSNAKQEGLQSLVTPSTRPAQPAQMGTAGGESRQALRPLQVHDSQEQPQSAAPVGAHKALQQQKRQVQPQVGAAVGSHQPPQQEQSGPRQPQVGAGVMSHQVQQSAIEQGGGQGKAEDSSEGLGKGQPGMEAPSSSSRQQHLQQLQMPPPQPRRVREDENTVLVGNNRYTKLECIGKGGSSKVFKVRTTSLSCT